MSMDKIVNVNLETTAQYQSLSNLNVQFWNQDKNTAVLQFKITRNDFPLSLSKENVEVFIKLESGVNYIVDSTEVVDGSFEIIDELNGVVSYTIPTEFMTVAKTVAGQVYVATKDREEVVVQRKFSFEVAEDLLSAIPASEKLREIKLFAQLRDEVSDTMAKLNEDFANMQDYVTMVNQAATDGVNQLNKLSDDKLTEYNSNHTEKLNEMTTTGDNYTTQFSEDKSYIDTKVEEFEQKLVDSDIVTQGESENWQKYKLTSDTGNHTQVSLGNDLNKLRELKPGFYYTTNTPITGASSTAGFTIVEQRDETVKRITFKPYNSNNTYVMRYYNEWNDWENALLDLESKQGSQNKANTAESNANSYTDDKISSQHGVLYIGTVSTVGSDFNLLGDLYDYSMIIISGIYPGGTFNEVVLTGSIDKNIVIQRDNLRDSDGLLLGTYELKIDVTNGTTLKLANDVSFDSVSGTSSGANRNAYIIQRIEGWK
ncbi:BppU family phage baseplate upper protein [Staphylococcus pseudoxylosus]|uniref:Phage baseplate upper protein n=1 Tax=Staphylococcus pseudoxylosus TaxID=2282419 RepID=A0AAQ0MHC6_9STAP|nr:BppU family phage baseplate upper protein [Staphylococcus pseudoxylosus]MCE5003193.1 BppU family phage baseplate upper protein [Staphylococcus pseudoxylosus]RMI85016.1 phage baseplate upper protein [Staphylococcus pseudoxylosus]